MKFQAELCFGMKIPSLPKMQLVQAVTTQAGSKGMSPSPPDTQLISVIKPQLLPPLLLQFDVRTA